MMVGHTDDCMGFLDGVTDTPSPFKPCPECGAEDWQKEKGFFNNTFNCMSCRNQAERSEIRKTFKQIRAEQKFGGGNWADYDQLSDNLKSRIEDKKIEGWEILKTEKDRVVMGKPKKAGVVKHGVVALFTAPLTMGLGNVAYHEHKKRQMDKIVLREDGTTEAESSDDPLDRLQQLRELRDEGTITDEEFAKKKEDILSKV